MDFAVPADHRVKLKESKKRNKYLNLARELKKPMEHESGSDTICNWSDRDSYKRIDTGTGGLGNKRETGDHSNNSIVEIGQNSKKSPGGLSRLAVTQTQVENYQLMLVGKTL